MSCIPPEMSVRGPSLCIVSVVSRFGLIRLGLSSFYRFSKGQLPRVLSRTAETHRFSWEQFESPPVNSFGKSSKLSIVWLLRTVMAACIPRMSSLMCLIILLYLQQFFFYGP